jgi:hypothetical protein
VVQFLKGYLRSKLPSPLTPQYNSAPRNPKHPGSALLPLCISHACVPLLTNIAVQATVHQHARRAPTPERHPARATVAASCKLWQNMLARHCPAFSTRPAAGTVFSHQMHVGHSPSYIKSKLAGMPLGVIHVQ